MEGWPAQTANAAVDIALGSNTISSCHPFTVEEQKHAGDVWLQRQPMRQYTSILHIFTPPVCSGRRELLSCSGDGGLACTGSQSKTIEHPELHTGALYPQIPESLKHAGGGGLACRGSRCSGIIAILGRPELFPTLVGRLPADHPVAFPTAQNQVYTGGGGLACRGGRCSDPGRSQGPRSLGQKPGQFCQRVALPGRSPGAPPGLAGSGERLDHPRECNTYLNL